MALTIPLCIHDCPSWLLNPQIWCWVKPQPYSKERVLNCRHPGTLP